MSSPQSIGRIDRDISWGANCDVCEIRLNAGRAAELLEPDGSVVCGSCRDDERARVEIQRLRDALAARVGR